MRIDRWKRTAVSAFSGIGVALFCGCAGEPCVLGESCVLDDSEAIWQHSPTGQAVALVDPVAYGCLLGQDSLRGSHVECIVKEFLGRFESDAEAIVIIHNFERQTSLLHLILTTLNVLPKHSAEYRSFYHHLHLRFVESGLGQPPPEWATDPSWAPANLRGLLFLPRRQELVAGTFLHEFGHRWAAHLVGPPGLAEQIEKYGHHWGYTSVGGLLGGWLPDTLESLGGNVYQADIAPVGRGTNIFPYAPLELYLMGLAEAEEVPPIEIAMGAEMVERSEGTFSVTSFETVTIEDIVEANGPRIPTSSESEKHFRLALIILTDHELSDAEWDFYTRSIDFAAAARSSDVVDFFPEETYSEYYRSLSAMQNQWVDSAGRDPEQVLLNFYMATGGRGTIEFVQIAGK